MRIDEVTDKPQFVLVMGGGGSGKNYYIAHDPALRSYKLIDVDAIKGAMGVSAAISAIKPMLADAFKSGINVAHPTTGSNLKGQQNKIALARQYGYEVVVILKKTNPTQAVANVANRVASGGHDVDYDAILASNEKALANFEQLKSLADFSKVV
jgi:predicted ABC-type ATPase